MVMVLVVISVLRRVPVFSLVYVVVVRECMLVNSLVYVLIGCRYCVRMSL